MLTPTQWTQFASWWRQTAKRLGVDTQCESFLAPESGGMEALMKVHGAQGDLDYVLFVMIRYWVPPILPPAGKERTVKSDPDYWTESERDRKSTRLNSSHSQISYAVFCLKKKKRHQH